MKKKNEDEAETKTMCFPVHLEYELRIQSCWIFRLANYRLIKDVNLGGWEGRFFRHVQGFFSLVSGFSVYAKNESLSDPCE